MTTPGGGQFGGGVPLRPHNDEPVSLAGTGQLLGTSKLQESIDQFAKSVDKLEGIVTKAQQGLGGGQGATGAT